MLVLLLYIVAGCHGIKSFQNQPHYEIEVGDEIKLFHSTNSCCHFCINENDLNHVLLVADKLIDGGPNGCDGCNHTRAFVLSAISSGTDSVLLTLQTAPRSCADSVFVRNEWYVVKVK